MILAPTLHSGERRVRVPQNAVNFSSARTMKRYSVVAMGVSNEEGSPVGINR
jgi:hypothetical protein